MKIGAFAKKFAVSVDTVRYYIDLGLLLPDKKASAQYAFTPSCLEDMVFINELKQYQFSLQEIHKVLSFKRITGFTVTEDVHNYYLNLLADKKRRLQDDKDQLENAIRRIAEKMAALQTNPGAGQQVGVPYSFLPLLSCPSCRIPLQISNATIQGKYVQSGQLHCLCAYQAEITDGILVTNPADAERTTHSAMIMNGFSH